MSEVVSRLQRMLGQAQQFSEEAPLEAVARAKSVLKAAQAALGQASPADGSQLAAIVRIASARVAKYEGAFKAWNGGVRERERTFVGHEQDRIKQPIPAKV